MTPGERLLEESAEDLFENAPCGYLSTRPDGTIVRVNRTFASWIGHAREALVGMRLQDLLTPGGRIYHETHYAPLLRMQGSVSEIAVEIVRADGSRLPALINSVLRSDDDGVAQLIRTTVFDATDRRRYEQELLRAQRREREIARQLQASLLTGELPRGPGFELAVAYHPAVAGLQVGGDWYDAFWLGDRRLGLVVGDVVGRGIEAAATMGQLRSALRALASTGLRPGPLLDALDEYSRRHGVGQMATIVYAQVDLETREMLYACAGHPPPVVMAPDAEPQTLWEGRSTPLDVYAMARPGRAEATFGLQPGSVLLLCTDGLIERRAWSITEGIAALHEALSARRGGDVGAVVRDVVRDLREREHADDVCALGLGL